MQITPGKAFFQIAGGTAAARSETPQAGARETRPDPNRIERIRPEAVETKPAESRDNRRPLPRGSHVDIRV
ncbi:MAG: hypothetical protein FJX67_05180 [Alphaproteobacteria bacterium]|nr:hypothetical protein [Alphaproteobacteria bacterium]